MKKFDPTTLKATYKKPDGSTAVLVVFFYYFRNWTNLACVYGLEPR